MTDLMNNDPLYLSILEILAVTVLIDQEERDSELIEFTHAGVVINQYLFPDTIVSRDCLLNWYKENKSRIETSLLASDADDYKISVLSAVKDKAAQKKTLSSMFIIAVCDYELHDEESDFIKKAVSVWQTTMPNAQDLDKVA
jgi:hypothetical protein